jgi:hypothetical protein
MPGMACSDSIAYRYDACGTANVTYAYPLRAPCPYCGWDGISRSSAEATRQFRDGDIFVTRETELLKTVAAYHGV